MLFYQDLTFPRKSKSLNGGIVIFHLILLFFTQKTSTLALFYEYVNLGHFYFLLFIIQKTSTLSLFDIIF